MALADARRACRYAFERDEALSRQQAELKVHSASSNFMKVAQQLTALEVKHADLRVKYEADLRGLIDLKLRLAELEAERAES